MGKYSNVNSYGNSYKRIKSSEIFGIPAGPNLPAPDAEDGMCLFIHTDSDYQNGRLKMWDTVNWVDVVDPDRYGEATTVSANTFEIIFDPALLAYQKGEILKIKFDSSNTGPVTVAPNSLPAREVVLPGGTSLSGGEIVTDGLYLIAVTDTALQLLSGSSGGGGSIPSGGTTGQVLTKQSAADGDADWDDLPTELVWKADEASFPLTGEDGKAYVARDTGLMYRWDTTGSEYKQIGGGGSTWGTITGTLTDQTDLTAYIASQTADGDTAFSWGNHALAGYLTSIPANTTLMGNTFNGADQLVKLDGSGKLPAVDGSLLTGITVSGALLADGTVPLTGDWDAGNHVISITRSGMPTRAASDGITLINTNDGDSSNSFGEKSPRLSLRSKYWDSGTGSFEYSSAFIEFQSVRSPSAFGVVTIGLKRIDGVEKTAFQLDSNNNLVVDGLTTQSLSSVGGTFVTSPLRYQSSSTGAWNQSGVQIYTTGTASAGNPKINSPYLEWRGSQYGTGARSASVYANVIIDQAGLGDLPLFGLYFSSKNQVGAQTYVARIGAYGTVSGLSGLFGELADVVPSAVLEVRSTTKGFLPPRMTTTQWGMISSKEEGLQAWSNDDHGQLWFDGTGTIGFRYNRSTSKFQGFDGTNWVDLN